MRLHAYISGQVQMVGFRYNTRLEAQELGIIGWVKNLTDGRVEVVAEGEKKLLNDFLEWLKHGPRLAKVTNVDYKFKEETGEFSQFKVVF